MGRTWIRLYCGTYHHHKLRLLMDRVGRDGLLLWYCLLDLAGEINDGGWIYQTEGIPFTTKSIKKHLGLDMKPSKLEPIFGCMLDLKLIEKREKGILIRNFEKRQFITDISTPRVQKHRESQLVSTPMKRSKTVTDEDISTPMKRNSTVSETAHKQKQKHIKIIPPLPPLEKTPPPPAATRQRVAENDNGYDPDFEEWWAAYPGRRKKGKPKVHQKWRLLKKSHALPSLREMLEVLAAQKKSLDWTKDGGEYIPGPLPYLNQAQFQDESVRPPPQLVERPEVACLICKGTGWEELGDNTVRRCRCVKEYTI